MDILLALLASLALQMEAASAKIDTGKDAKENKVFVADLNKICDEIESTQKQIDELKVEEAASAKALERVNSLKAAPKPQSARPGGLEASDIKVGLDNVYKDAKLGFKNYGDVAMAVYNAAVNPSARDPRLAVIASGNPDLEAAGLRQGVGPEGGFLVPAGVRSAELQTEAGLSLDLFSRTRNFQLGKQLLKECL